MDAKQLAQILREVHGGKHAVDDPMTWAAFGDLINKLDPPQLGQPEPAACPFKVGDIVCDTAYGVRIVVVGTCGTYYPPGSDKCEGTLTPDDWRIASWTEKIYWIKDDPVRGAYLLDNWAKLMFKHES